MLEVQRDVAADDVTHGCLASFVVMVVSMFAISLVFTVWLGWLSADGEKLVSAGRWLVAICVGGYVAARRSRAAGRKVFNTSLWLGIAALLFVLAKLPEQPNGDFFDSLREIVLNPLTNARYLLLLVFTIPAALLGWLIAERMASTGPQKNTPVNDGNQPPRQPAIPAKN